MTDVQGRTAFITGGANGIGLGIARAFAQAGARLALADMDEAALDLAKAELQAITPVEIFRLDVRDRTAFAEAADAAESALGPVSLLFNNAGVAAATSPAKLTYDQWDWSIGINLGGVINGVQTFLPRMIQSGQGGHIVNTSSGASLASTGFDMLYTTGKFAVVGMSEALHGAGAEFGIGVSVLCPGPVATDLFQRSAGAVPRADLSTEEAQHGEAVTTFMISALKQGTHPDEVGQMVLNAVRENRLYIHTDRLMEDLIKTRTQALLDALPG